MNLPLIAVILVSNDPKILPVSAFIMLDRHPEKVLIPLREAMAEGSPNSI
jgi:hypothetical protein